MSVRPIPTPDSESNPMPESQLQQTPMASPARDVRNLQKNSGAVAGELREFLAKMEGKSPKEVLGAIATSGLGSSFVQATVLFVIVGSLATVGPYFYGLATASDEQVASEETQPAENGEQPAENGEQPEANGENQTAATTANAQTNADAQAAGVNLENGEEIIDKLGVGDTKDAPANVNPLDGATDDLLDGLD